MKKRVTLTIDPTVVRRARKVVHARNTSMSGLVEELLRSAAIPGEERGSFVDRWEGRFAVAESAPGDQRMMVLKAKHRLADR
jgi:hypothetical protein